MHGLTVGSAAAEFHEKTLGCSEYPVGFKVAADRGLVDVHAGDDFLRGDQDLVKGEEGLRQEEAAVGAVIQGPFEDGQGCVVPGVGDERMDVASEAVDLLAVDGIALERHGRGAHLGLAEGFAPLAYRRALQHAEIEGELCKNT